MVALSSRIVPLIVATALLMENIDILGAGDLAARDRA